MSQPIGLTQANQMDREAFAAAFGSVFEHFPQAAGDAWAHRPFASAGDLHAAMMDVVRKLDDAGQRAFLNLHPPLSGRAIRANTMTADSSAEQKSAGLDNLSAGQEGQLDRLNAEYLARHGFPFIVCVRHYTREGIFAQFERRLGRSTAQEQEEALAQIAAITRGRLAARLAG